jgi:3-hydroxyisobutyrate dehydrogenase-like beta-hydroxyacid dehydrogenase
MGTIGFIGIGEMGGRLATFLLRAGFTVTVYDINRARIQELTKIGATESAGPRDLASKCDVVLTVLTYPNVVEEVILGKGGVLEGLRKSAIVMECSSIDPETSLRVADQVRAAGGRFVEVALMGPPNIVEAKQLLFLTAGEKETVESCTALFAAMGRKVLYVGGFGKAKLLKIAYAMLHAAEATALYEIVAWLIRNGVTAEAFLEGLRARMTLRLDQVEQVLKGDLPRPPSWVAKDVYHGIMNAEEKEIPMPVLSTVQSVINLAKSQGFDEYAFAPMIWKLYEKTLAKKQKP